MSNTIFFAAFTALWATGVYSQTLHGDWTCADKSPEGEMQMSMSFSPEGTLKSEVLLKFEEEGAEIVAELTALSRYEYLPAGILRDRPTDTTLLSLTADGFDIKDLPEARELVDYLLMSSEETYRVDRLTNSELVMSANGESLTCFR